MRKCTKTEHKKTQTLLESALTKQQDNDTTETVSLRSLTFCAYLLFCREPDEKIDSTLMFVCSIRSCSRLLDSSSQHKDWKRGETTSWLLSKGNKLLLTAPLKFAGGQPAEVPGSHRSREEIVQRITSRKMVFCRFSLVFPDRTTKIKYVN